MCEYVNKKEMEVAIKIKREKMIRSAYSYGFTSPETLKCSQELDVLINQYQKLYRKPEEDIEIFDVKMEPIINEQFVCL